MRHADSCWPLTITSLNCPCCHNVSGSRSFDWSEIYAREGVDLDRSTLAKWVGETSQLLEPLVDALRRYVLGANELHADDTPIPVLAPGHQVLT